MKIKNFYYISILLLTLFSTVAFVWHNELVFTAPNDNVLTNGWKVVEGVKVYHAWMYIMFSGMILVSIIILNFIIEDEGWRKNGKAKNIED